MSCDQNRRDPPYPFYEGSVQRDHRVGKKWTLLGCLTLQTEYYTLSSYNNREDTTPTNFPITEVRSETPQFTLLPCLSFWSWTSLSRILVTTLDLFLKSRPVRMRPRKGGPTCPTLSLYDPIRSPW